MIDISSYLEMIIALFIAFGLAFEVPLVLITAVKFNWIKIKTLENNRKYIQQRETLEKENDII